MSVDVPADEEFEQFALRELVGLLRYAVTLTGDPELARDLVQDVMLKAYDHWSRVSAADHPNLYIKTMLTRQFLSWRRRWSVRKVSVGIDEHIGPPASPDHAALIADRSDLWQRLAGLPRQQRAVLALRYYEQLTDPEIATVLGCSPVTVRSYASRALAALRLDLVDETGRSKERQ
jgi:RNA polymerase sigma-70 factor (sigma-E family)